MELGDIIYISTIDLKHVLAINQKLYSNRFCKIENIQRVKGGTNDNEYLNFDARSILSPDTSYTINNYLSPYRAYSIKEVEDIVKELDAILLPAQKEDIDYLIKKIKQI